MKNIKYDEDHFCALRNSTSAREPCMPSLNRRPGKLAVSELASIDEWGL